MAGEWNWTGELQLIVQNGAIDRVRREVQSGLSGIDAKINLDVSSRSAVDGLSGSVGNLGAKLQALRREQEEVRTATASMAASVSASSNIFEEFGRRIDLSARRVLSFTAAAGSIYAITSAFKESLVAATQFEQEMVRLDQVGGLSQTQIRSVGDEIGRLSTRFGTSSSSLAATAVALRQAGVAADEMAASLSAVSKASLTPGFGGDVGEITRRTTELVRLGVAGKDLEATFAGVNAVSRQFGVESQDVLAGVTKSGAAFQRFGGNLTELAALIAAVKRESNESGEAVSGSLRQIFQRFERPASIASLRELGVELTRTREEALALGQANLEGTFIGPLAAVKRLGDALGQLRSNDPRVSAISDELGVPRGASRVLSALSQRDSIQKAVNASIYAEVDLDGQAEKSQGTLASQTARLKEQFLELGRAIYDNGLKTIASDLVKISSGFVSVLDAARPVLPLFTALAAIKLGQGVGSFIGGFGRGPATQPRLASGGIVPGSGDGDSVHSLLTPGEFVIRKAAAQAIGYERLHRLNQTHAFPARYATGGVVGAEQHPFGNFDPADFGGFVGSVRAEAAKLQIALSAATSVFVEFAETGPIFRGFAQAAKEAAAQIRAPQPRISLRDEAFQAELAKELVGTKASRTKLVTGGFLSADVSDAITAGPEGKLTTAQELSRVKRAERANRLQALQSFYASHEDIWDTVDADVSSLIPPPPFARRQSSPSAASIATSSRALVPYVSRGVVPYSPPPDVIDAEFTVLPRLLEDRRRRRYNVADDDAAQRYQGRELSRAAGRDQYQDYIERLQSQQEVDAAIRTGRARQRDYVDPLAARASLRAGGVSLQAELSDFAETRRDNIYSRLSFAQKNPAEEAYQRSTLEQARFGDRANDFRRIIEEREAKRAGRGGADQLFDPLARREYLRSVGYSLDEELGPQAAQLRASRRPPKYASATLDELAQGRADTEIGRRGGADLISSKTKQAILAQQREAIEQELVSVTARQLGVLRPGIAKQEALNIAAEQLAQATAENAKVLRDGRGRVLGLAGNVASLPEGVRPDVRSRIGSYLAGKFPSLERFGGLSNIGFFGASVAGSYAAAGLDSYAGSAADAVAGGSEGRFRGFRAGGSALQGALIGGAVGSAILPGYGTAIGAAIGGLHAFASSLGETAKALQDVRIANASNDLGENLRALAVPGADFSTFDAAQRNLRTVRSEQTEKNRSEATSFLGNLDVEAFAGLQRKGLRDSIGGQLPQIGSYLNRQAEELAKSNLGVEAKELAVRLHDGGQGLNRGFISVIASLRGSSVDKVVGDFSKTILEAQRTARLQQDAQKVQAEQDRTLNAFGRLSQAVELSAAGLITLQSQSHAIGDVFAGRVSATPVGGLSELLSHPGNPNRGEYLSALGGVSSLLGPGGVRLRETGQAASDLQRVLPSVLSQVLGQNPLDESDFASKTRSLTRSALGYKDGDKLPPQLSAGLDAVVSGLNQKKLPDIVREAGNDVTAFSKKLLESFSGPVTDASVKIAHELQKNANLFISELAAAASRAATIRDSAGRVDTLALSSQRQAAIFRADDLGKPHSFLDLLSLEQLQRPFAERQRRLVGEGPVFNVDFLTDKLREVREQIGPATQRQQTALVKFGGGPQVDAASAELIRLKERASSLQEALGHLTNAAERSSGAQEKLSALQGDKDGRIGLLRRFVLGGPEEQIQLSRGSLLAVQAARTGLASLTPDDARAALHFTDAAGNIRLRGIPGAPTGKDLGDRLVGDLAPDLAQHPIDRAEEASLKAEITQNNKVAVDAQQALLTNLGELNREAAANTKRLQEEFFARLRDIFSKDALTDKNIQQAKVGADLGTLRGLSAQRDVLAKAGITDDLGVERIRGASVDIEALAAGKKKGLEARERVGEAIAPERIEQLYQQAYGEIGSSGFQNNVFGRSAFDSKAKSTLADALADPKGFGFAGSDVAKILGQFETRTTEAITPKDHPSGVPFPDSSIAEKKDLVKQQLRSAILSVGEEAARREGSDAVNAARHRLSGRGLDISRIERVVGDDGAGVGPLVKAAGAFGPDNLLSTLENRLAKTTAEFDGLGGAIRRLRAEIEAAGVGGGNAISKGEYKATGGPVSYRGFPGSPRGTDTVPTWLSPNEFVVNSKAAQKHLSLLHALNSGALHLADGGRVDPALAVVRGIADGDPDRRVDLVNQVVAARRRQEARQAEQQPAVPIAADDDHKQRLAVEAELRRQAFLNPGGASAQTLFGINFRGSDKQFQSALTANYYQQRTLAAIRRQQAAQLTDPWAAFGRGRPGIDAQRAIGTRGAAFAANPEELHSGGQHGDAVRTANGLQNAALLRGRLNVLQLQRLPTGKDDNLAVQAPRPADPGKFPAGEAGNLAARAAAEQQAQQQAAQPQGQVRWDGGAKGIAKDGQGLVVPAPQQAAEPPGDVIGVSKPRRLGVDESQPAAGKPLGREPGDFSPGVGKKEDTLPEIPLAIPLEGPDFDRIVEQRRERIRREGILPPSGGIKDKPDADAGPVAEFKPAAFPVPKPLAEQRQQQEDAAVEQAQVRAVPPAGANDIAAGLAALKESIRQREAEDKILDLRAKFRGIGLSPQYREIVDRATAAKLARMQAAWKAPKQKVRPDGSLQLADGRIWLRDEATMISPRDRGEKSATEKRQDRERGKREMAEEWAADGIDPAFLPDQLKPTVFDPAPTAYTETEGPEKLLPKPPFWQRRDPHAAARTPEGNIRISGSGTSPDRLREIEENTRKANAERDEAGNLGVTLRQLRERKAAMELAEADHKADGGLIREQSTVKSPWSELAPFAVSASKDNVDWQSGASLSGLGAAAGPIATMQSLAARMRTEQLAAGKVPKHYRLGGQIMDGTGPRSDDVAAYLSKGEFVISAASAARIGSANLDRMNHFALGGMVPRYLAEGGSVGGSAPAGGGFSSSLMGPEALSAMSAFNDSAAKLASSMNNFPQSSLALAQGFTQFNDKAGTLAEALKQFNGSLKLEGNQRVEVIINGQEAFSRMNGAISEMIQDRVNTAIRTAFKLTIPEA